MANLPSPTPPEQPSRRLWLLKVGAGIGAVVAVGGIAGAIWGGRIINGKILPLVEAEVADIIERPIDLGDLERLSLSGIQLGETAIPSTETDASSVTVDKIRVDFDLRSLLFQKTLKPNIVLIRPNLSLVQGDDGQWVEISLPETAEEEPLITTEIQSLKVKDANLTATTAIQDPKAVVSREAIEASGVDVTAEFYGEDSKQIYFELVGDVDAGKFDIKGEANLIDQTAVKANVRLQNLPTTGVNLFLPALVGLKSGTLNTNLTVAAALDEDGALDQKAVDVQGTAQFRDGEVLVSDLPEPVRNIRSQLRFRGQQVTLEDTELQLSDVALLAAGTVDWQDGYNLTAQIPEVSLDDVQTLAALDLPAALPTATPFQLTTQATGKLDQPKVQGRLANLRPLQVDKLTLAAVTADFVIPLSDFELSNFELTELRVVPESGGEIVAQGNVDLSDLENPGFELTAQADLPVDPLTRTYGVALPSDIVIGALTATVEAEGTLETQTAFAQWQLADSTFPGQGDITLVDNVVTVDNTRLQIAGGTVDATATAQLEGGAWQATVATNQLPVAQFVSQVEGLLSADLEATGNLYDFDLARLQARGRAAIANAQINLTNEPLIEPGDWNTTFQWQGNQVAIETFTAPGIQADGTIGVDLNQTIPIGDLNLNVALQEFNLRPLNSFIPAVAQDYGTLAGLTSFDGQITGTISNPQLAGNARLDALAVNQLIFESLTGPVTFSLAEGGNVNLTGQQDRLQLAVNDQFWPVSFEIRNQDFVAQGTGEGNKVHADISQLPLDKLDLQPARDLGFGTLTGLLDASLDADLTDFANPTASGNLTVTEPSLNPVNAKQIAASFRYADNTATLAQGELLLENSQYLLTGSAKLTPNLQYQGELTIAEGRIEDLVAILERFDLSAFGIINAPEGTAADLAVEPVELPAGSFQQQLTAFLNFIENQPDTANNSGTLVIPPLADLSGGFTGTLAVAGDSPALEDVTASFNIQGGSWEWGPYAPPNQFLVKGDVQKLGINLEPALITAGETVVNLSGSGNLEQLTGQLTVDNLPVELAELIYPLPISVAGDLDLFTRFDGSLVNPAVTGDILIADTQIDQYPLEMVGANFSYTNARLDLAGEVVIDPDDEPITLQGSIPYALPFATVQPATNRLAIKAVVPDDSFDFINTLSQNQVRWEAGSGSVTAQVDGTLQQPIISGQVNLKDGVVSSPLLDDALTNLDGDIQFDLEQVDIQKLRANLGDGQLDISGQLPIFPFPIFSTGQPVQYHSSKRLKNRAKNTDGVMVSLNKLPIGYGNSIRSTFDGQVLIDGSVLLPTISGNVEISDGRIRPNEFLSQAGAISLPTETELEGTNPYRADFLGIDPLAPKSAEQPIGILNNVTLQDFKITLNSLDINGVPFYDIRALGGLTINGTLQNLKPDGTISLSSGWINLFSNQFRLDSKAPNTAKFIPENGLDPMVDVVMTTRIPENNFTRVPPTSGGFSSAEIDANTSNNLETVGDVQYINIEAIAQGPASGLADNLILTSNPDRTQDELLALLGSNVIGGLASGNFTQFAEFLGAGSISSFSNNIANTLGLRSLSVFPTTDTSTESNVGIGIGVEATFGLGSDINISVLEILNSGNPPQLGLQYRLNNQLQLEGSSDLDDTEFQLEYRIEF